MSSPVIKWRLSRAETTRKSSANEGTEGRDLVEKPGKINKYLGSEMGGACISGNESNMAWQRTDGRTAGLKRERKTGAHVKLQPGLAGPVPKRRLVCLSSLQMKF